MEIGLAAQYVVVALAVSASAGYVVTNRMPGATRRVRTWLALQCMRSEAGALRALGRKLAPAQPAATSCGSCQGCAPGG